MDYKKNWLEKEEGFLRRGWLNIGAGVDGFNVYFYMDLSGAPIFEVSQNNDLVRGSENKGS